MVDGSLLLDEAYMLASSPGHSQILSHGCKIKSGSGLGTGLLICSIIHILCIVTKFVTSVLSFLNEEALHIVATSMGPYVNL